MTNLLCRIFIKGYKEPLNPTTRKKYGTMASVVGILLNICLSLLKLVVGILTSSVAVTADALNNLSDAGASVMALISFKLSAKPADRDHPFGHARIEYIASMVVAFIILLVGFELFIDSGKTIFGLGEGKTPTFSIVSIIILAVSVLGKLWLGIFYRKIGKRINSSVILASSADSFSDCISTSAVLASSIVIKLTDWEIIDAIVGLAVSVMIIIAGVKILNETKNSLLGEAPVAETVDKMKEIISREPEVLGIHDMMVHNYGPGKYVASFHAEVDGAHDIFMLHDCIDNLERNIGEELNIQCTIHLDPVVTDDETVTELKQLAERAVKAVDERFGIHDFRAVVGVSHTNLIFDVEVPYECKESTTEIIEKICNEVKRIRSDCFCVLTVDRC